MTTRTRLVRAAVSSAVVLTVGAGVVGFGVLAAPEPAPRTEGPGLEPLLVEALAVEWEDAFTITRSFVGRVEARQETDLGFEIPGTIDEILVEEGDAIPAGSPVARLNTDRLGARRAELVAARDRAAADSELAELRFGRTADARDSNAASKLEYDDAEQGLRAERAALAAAAAAVDTIDTEIAKAVIASPFDAVVAERLADTGRVIGAGTPVARLFERTNPEVRFALAGAAADALAIGQPLPVRVRDRSVSGTVSAVLPTRDAAARGVDVIVRLDARLNGIRRGDLARLDLPRERRARGFWIPTLALTEGVRGLWSVYLLEPAEDAGAATIVRADVAVLHEEAERVYVSGALAPGDRVVASGLHRITPGMTVRVAAPAASAQGGGTP
jgi:RND family efflux transporter MFP subunit